MTKVPFVARAYGRHLASAMFPELPEEQFRAIVESMKKDGWDEASAIRLWNGEIFDGWHRALAAQEASLDHRAVRLVSYDHLTVDEVYSMARREQFSRRNLNATQRCATVFVECSARGNPAPSVEVVAETAGCSVAHAKDVSRFCRNHPDRLKIIGELAAGTVTIRDLRERYGEKRPVEPSAPAPSPSHPVVEAGAGSAVAASHSRRGPMGRSANYLGLVGSAGRPRPEQAWLASAERSLMREWQRWGWTESDGDGFGCPPDEMEWMSEAPEWRGYRQLDNWRAILRQERGVEYAATAADAFLLADDHPAIVRFDDEPDALAELPTTNVLSLVAQLPSGARERRWLQWADKSLSARDVAGNWEFAGGPDGCGGYVGGNPPWQAEQESWTGYRHLTAWQHCYARAHGRDYDFSAGGDELYSEPSRAEADRDAWMDRAHTAQAAGRKREATLAEVKSRLRDSLKTIEEMEVRLRQKDEEVISLRESLRRANNRIKEFEDAQARGQ